jgi:hypothetical protein
MNVVNSNPIPLKFRVGCLAALAGCLALMSCKDSSNAGWQASISSAGVQLRSFKIEAGRISDAQLREGLRSAANALSVVYAEKRKTLPQLKGHLRGTAHIEPSGAIRMFAEKNSELTPPEGKSLSEDFIGASFGGKWKFPAIGNDVMITVDFELAPGG